jgi:outer membrane biosynthesis protein TonB
VTESRAILIAGAGHLALLAALSLTWGLVQRNMPPLIEPIPIDIVDISDVPRVTEKPKPSIEAAPREQIEASVIEAPVPELKPIETPEIEEEAPKKVPPPPPKEKVEPKPKPKPKPAQELSDLVDKAIAEAPRKTKPSDFAKSIEEAIPEGAKLDAKTSATLAQAIRDRIYPCWNPNVGGASAREITTLLRVRVTRSGDVIGRPQILSQGGLTPDNRIYARVASDAAVRAVMNPDCSLAGLPPELYEGWKEFELNFDWQAK